MFGKKQNERFVFRYIYFIFRDEIIAEYDGKMRDANEREQQFLKRIQSNIITDSPKEVQPPVSTVSSASSLSFHTPAIDQSPTAMPIMDSKPTIVSPSLTIENMNNVETLDLMSIRPIVEIQSVKKPIIRHTATEETTQAEYRSVVKHVPSNVLKSTIQNYMIDHNPLDESQGKGN